MPQTATDTFLGQITVAEATLTNLVPEVDPELRAANRATTGRETLGNKAGAALEGAFADWRNARPLMVDAANRALETFAGDNRLSPEARSEDVAAIADAARAQVRALLESAESKVDGLRDVLRSATLPARPATSDVAGQEAALANLRTDLRMVWDALPPVALVPAMLDHLTAYVASHDDLAVWLLGASEWPSMYLTSRDNVSQDAAGATLADQYAAQVADVLARGEDEEGNRARAILKVIDGPTGWLAASLAMRYVVDTAFADIAAYRFQSADLGALS